VYTRKIFLLLPALIAMMLRFIVTYLVIVDSISIILTSKTVKAAIFDCLAITFLLELNGYYWKVLHTVFHFDPPDVTEVNIQYNQAVWKDRTDPRSALSAIGERSTIWPSFVNALSRNIPCRDGLGGRRFESMLVSVITLFLAMRQVFLIMHALHTNISPMARDICWEWRFQERNQFTKRLVNAWLWIDIRELVVNIVDNKLKAENCEYGGKYYGTELSDMVATALDKPLQFGFMAVLLFFLLLAPAVTDLAPKHLSFLYISQGSQARSKVRDSNLLQRIAELERLVEEQGKIIKKFAD